MKQETIDEYSAKTVLFKHKKTGAEVLSVSVADENKVFMHGRTGEYSK